MRVALVEDDPVFRGAVLHVLRGAADVEIAGVATTQAEGLAMLAGAPADVLVADLGLPDGSGLEVVRACRTAWPDCAALVSTAFGDEQHVLTAIQAGAAGYVLKDSPGPDLLDQIRMVRAGGSPISPLIARRVMDLLRAPAATAAPEPAPEPQPHLLSPRESEVLRLTSIGFTYEEIAQRMQVSRHTVQTFIRRIYAKLDVNTKMEAVNEARRKGLLRP
jgi:DNA-binding NarL/FixJ family response regulator